MLFSFLLGLSACATTANYQRKVNNWQGNSIQALTQAWGYPDVAVKLPNGNTVYMYSREQRYSVPTHPMAPATIINVGGKSAYASSFNGVVATGQTVSRYCRTWFEVNRKGIIVNSRFQGNNCIA